MEQATSPHALTGSPDIGGEPQDLLEPTMGRPTVVPTPLSHDDLIGREEATNAALARLLPPINRTTNGDYEELNAWVLPRGAVPPV